MYMQLGHGTVFRTKWLNKVFLYLASLLSWWDPFNYAMNHTYHHRYTLHSKGVREVLLPLTPSLKPTFLLQMFTINLFTQSGRTFGKADLFQRSSLPLRQLLVLGSRRRYRVASGYKPCTLISRTRHENQCGGHG